MILDDIIVNKKKQLKIIKEQVPIDDLKKNIDMVNTTRDFAKALTDVEGISIIGEIKRASPSKGIIKESFDWKGIAKEYEDSKVEAISVLTETTFFKGNNKYLTQTKEITTVPILRKDFIIDCYQIFEAKAIGADAILLITSILQPNTLAKFIELSKAIGLCALVEIHNYEELQIALECDAKIIGINNRDLKSFTTNLRNTEELVKYIPKDRIVVSESGIKDKNDMILLKKLGVQSALIGESLMRAPSIKNKISELRSCF